LSSSIPSSSRRRSRTAVIPASWSGPARCRGSYCSGPLTTLVQVIPSTCRLYVIVWDRSLGVHAQLGRSEACGVRCGPADAVAESRAETWIGQGIVSASVMSVMRQRLNKSRLEMELAWPLAKFPTVTTDSQFGKSRSGEGRPSGRTRGMMSKLLGVSRPPSALRRCRRR
jgi:hypothetical protein